MSDETPITGPPAKLSIPVCRTQSEIGELRAEGGGGMPVMEGHFSVFDDWYEINSYFEGEFMERIAPGAFKKTFKDDASRKNAGDKIKCILEHGHDYTVGDKPLGVPRSLSEDGTGAAYEVPLLDTSYVRDLIPALEAGAYGASFRFRVLVDEWVEKPERSDTNPNGIPERTIKEVRVMEFGPTMFPASAGASSGLRSTTDDYYQALRSRKPEEFQDAMRSARETRAASPMVPGKSAPAYKVGDKVTVSKGDRVEGQYGPGTVTAVNGMTYSVKITESGTVVNGIPAGDLSAAASDQKNSGRIVPDAPADTSTSGGTGDPVTYADPDQRQGTPPRAAQAVIKAAPTTAASTPARTGAAPSKTTEPSTSHSAGDTNPTGKQRSSDMPAEDLTMTVAEREQRQAEIRTRLSELDAEYNGSVLPDERQEEWDAISAEYDVHTVAVRAATARASRIAALSGEPGHTESGTPFHAPNVRRTPDNIYDITAIRRDARNMDDMKKGLRDNALRAVEQSRFDSVADEDATRTHIDKLLRRVDDREGTLARSFLVTGNPTYDRAFGKACMAGNVNGLTNEERAALAVGATTTGGFAVPFTLDPSVILTDGGVVNPIRQIARVVQITGKQWQGVTSAGISVSRAAEAAEVGDNSPTLAQPTVTPTRVQGFVPFSFEIDQDWSQMRAELATMFAEAKDTEESAAFITGSGVDPNPEGVITGVAANAGSLVGLATPGTFTIGDLYKPVDALPPRHTTNASWLASKGIYNRVRQLDTSGGANLWARISDGRPSRLVDFPVYEASTMVSGSDITTANTRLLLLGDFKKFLIVDRIGMSVELIPHLFHTANNRPSGQRGMYAIWRNSSKVLDPNAFRLLETS